MVVMGMYYPVNLNLENKKCLVVGGGQVAERKVQSLLTCQARVFVVSPELTALLDEQALNKDIILIRREYKCTDLEGYFLVISATDDQETNRKVAADCLERNILINTVDSPELCNFFVPAVVRRGDLAISVSTGGKSPLLARKIREDLEKAYGSEYEELLKIMGELRKDILTKVPDEKLRRIIFETILQTDILSLLAEGNHELVKGRVLDVLSSCGTKL